MILNQGDAASKGQWAMSGDIAGCHNWVGGSTVIWWGREMDAVQHLIMPMTAPTAKNCLAPNVTSAEAEDP